MSARWIESGPKDAEIIIVGESPGEYEIDSGLPFRGASGQELDRMLADAGLDRSRIFCTNVAHERPPSYRNKKGKWVHNDIDQWFLSKTVARKEGICEVKGRFPANPVSEGAAHLYELLHSRKPKLVLALGNTPLWAITGQTGITKWRGSTFQNDDLGRTVATFHPADVLRSWTHRPVVVQDFRRAAREASNPTPHPRDTWRFVTAPTLDDVRAWLTDHTDPSRPLVCDTEGWGRVDCIGFASSSRDAICIPFTAPGRPNYWSFEDEEIVLALVRKALTTCPIVFHNAIWDCQVIAHDWGFLPNLAHDTQVAQHVAFPGLIGGKIDPVTGAVSKTGSSLSLSFIASMYCEHYRFWKDDGRLWDADTMPIEQYWAYNSEDCVRTYECLDRLLAILDHAKLREQYEFEMALFGPVLRMMFRGIRIDVPALRAFRASVDAAKTHDRVWLNEATGHDFNPESNPQMKALFYNDLALPEIKNRKTGAATLDDRALETIARKNPLLRPIISRIQHYRTLDTIKDDLNIDALSPTDQRLRCAINIGYVETMRFSTNETAFGEGGNVQNLPRPPEDV